jgi:multidrug transporter EmrE-like cation transporter
MDMPSDLLNVSVLTCLSAIGDFSLKAYSLGKKSSGLAIGFAAYGLIVTNLAKNLGRDGVAYTNNMWNAGTSLLETLIALWQGEPLSNLNKIGVGLILAGAFLLNSGRY